MSCIRANTKAATLELYEMVQNNVYNLIDTRINKYIKVHVAFDASASSLEVV